MTEVLSFVVGLLVVLSVKIVDGGIGLVFVSAFSVLRCSLLRRDSLCFAACSLRRAE